MQSRRPANDNSEPASAASCGPTWGMRLVRKCLGDATGVSVLEAKPAGSNDRPSRLDSMQSSAVSSNFTY